MNIIGSKNKTTGGEQSNHWNPPSLNKQLQADIIRVAKGKIELRKRVERLATWNHRDLLAIPGETNPKTTEIFPTRKQISASKVKRNPGDFLYV